MKREKMGVLPWSGVHLSPMIDLEEALERILRHAHPLAPIEVPLSRSCGYVLARPAVAKERIPRFRSTSVDGFAVRVEDLRSASRQTPLWLPVQKTVPAGRSPLISLEKGHTVKIFTGALLPRYANAVVMKESVLEKSGAVLFRHRPQENENIREAGAEFRRGQIVHSRGTRITPAVVGMLGTLGYGYVTVYKKPRVGLVITGDELRLPSSKLQMGQIRDSNSFSLSAALGRLGIPPVFVVRSKDDPRRIKSIFSRALVSADVVISIGGVSVGEHDFVKEVLKELKVRTVFWRVAMKPGKPNYFGARKGTLVFGLPGNPVSALVSFEVLVKPALRKMVGMESVRTPLLKAKVGGTFSRDPGRLEFMRATGRYNEKGEIIVTPTSGQGSHMLGGLAKANCLIVIPKDIRNIAVGQIVDIIVLDWDL